MNNSISATITGGEIVIAGTRQDFAYIASICSRLAALSDSDLQTPVNHFHFMPGMRNTSPGSQPLVLQALPETPSTDAQHEV